MIRLNIKVGRTISELWLYILCIWKPVIAVSECIHHPSKVSIVSRTNVEHRFSEDPKVPDISFPPGRPTSSNIGLICGLRKLRPRYQLKCLPSNSYGWLARQAKAMNRMEKAIKQCCKDKNEVLTCADGKVRESCFDSEKYMRFNSFSKYFSLLSFDLFGPVRVCTAMPVQTWPTNLTLLLVMCWNEILFALDLENS